MRYFEYKDEYNVRKHSVLGLNMQRMDIEESPIVRICTNSVVDDVVKEMYNSYGDCSFVIFDSNTPEESDLLYGVDIKEENILLTDLHKYTEKRDKEREMESERECVLVDLQFTCI